jgi:hypothetical protein
MIIRHEFELANIPSGSTVLALSLGLKFEAGLKGMIDRGKSWGLGRQQFWQSFEEEKLWLARVISFDSVASRASRPVADDIRLTITRNSSFKAPKSTNEMKSRGLLRAMLIFALTASLPYDEVWIRFMKYMELFS